MGEGGTSPVPCQTRAVRNIVRGVVSGVGVRPWYVSNTTVITNKISYSAVDSY